MYPRRDDVVNCVVGVCARARFFVEQSETPSIYGFFRVGFRAGDGDGGDGRDILEVWIFGRCLTGPNANHLSAC